MASRNVISNPPRLPLIAASILSADFAALAADSRRALESGADLLHLDVMDGHFVPNLTMGPALCDSLRRALPDATLDAHLMVTDPAPFIRPFADAGADHVTVHVEVARGSDDLAAMAEEIHEAGMTAGLAINPPTDVAAARPHLGHFDLVLVMSVNPGFSGQSFMEDVLGKVRVVKQQLRPDQRLQMDGGINARTAESCLAAGCDVIVAASAIFKAGNYRDAIASLRAPGPDSREAAVRRSAARRA